MRGHQQLQRTKRNFQGSVGPHGAAKQVTEIVDIFQLFYNIELKDKIAEETNKYAKHFPCGHKLSRSTATARKPVTGRNLSYWASLWLQVLFKNLP
jgi:hypothetical protein